MRPNGSLQTAAVSVAAPSIVAPGRSVVNEAKRETRELVIRHGADEAVARVEIHHAETIAELDEKQRAKVDRLRSNPAALSGELTSIGLRRVAAKKAARRKAAGR